MPQRFVIIGNGIAGTTCAETLKAEDPTCSVTLIGLEPYPLYNRVSLPRYIKGLPRERVMLRNGRRACPARHRSPAGASRDQPRYRGQDGSLRRRLGTIPTTP